MHLLHTLLPCCLALSLTAQDAKVRVHGLVIDENEEPLAGVAVCPFSSGQPFLAASLAARPATITRADGTFELAWDRRQRPEFDCALFVAEGRVHVAAGLGYLDMMPVTLPRARTLAGTVRDAAGKPLAGVRVEARDWLACCHFLGRAFGAWSAVPEPRTAVRTDGSGRFILTGTCETAISLVVGGEGFTLRRYGPLAAWQSLDAVVVPVPVVTVQVVDAAGRPAPGVRLRSRYIGTTEESSWEGGYSDGEGCWRFTWHGQSATIEASDDLNHALGMLELREPGERVRLQLAEPPAQATAAAARAKPGTVAVRGRVIDPMNGVPVADAIVRAVAPGEAKNVEHYVMDGGAGHFPNPDPTTKTGADGTFVLHLVPGSHCLVAAVGGQVRPTGWGRNPTPLPLLVEAGKEPAPIELPLQPLVTVHGKTALATPPTALYVRFVPHRPGWGSSAEEYDWSLRFPVARDGTFAADSLLAHAYELQLLAPRLFRQGMPDKIPIGVVHIAAGNPVEVDARAALPARVRGTVRSPVPCERLAVVSVAPNRGPNLIGYCCYYGPICPVARDGTFVLREPAGERVLLAIDLWSGILLHRGEQVAVAAGTVRQVDLEVAAVPLEVRCEGLPVSDAAWLDIAVSEKFWPKGLSQMVKLSKSNPSGSLGVPVRRDAGPVQLWLPPGPTRLILRTQQGMRDDGKDLIAEVTVDPSEPEQQKVLVKPR